MKLKRVFFDLDGTLTDSMPGITRGVQYALKHYGIHVDDLSVLKPFVGPPLFDSFKRYYNFSDKDANDAIYVFREYYDVKGWMDNAPFDGVEDMLKTLKEAGLELYVATSKPEETAKKVLEYFQLTEYFKFIGGASMDEARVNKDDVIRYVLEENCISEEEKPSVIMVGDREHDVYGAKKTGLSVIGVLYGYGSREYRGEWSAPSAQQSWFLPGRSYHLRFHGLHHQAPLHRVLHAAQPVHFQHVRKAYQKRKVASDSW